MREMERIEEMDVYVITHDEMKRLKKDAEKLLDVLPEDDTQAMLTIVFLKELMEKAIGKKILKIEVR